LCSLVVIQTPSLADLPEPSAQGNLSTTPLSHVLLYALDEKLTGTIEFSLQTGPAATILFVEGRPTKARTTLVDYYLSRALVDMGFMTEEQHASVLPRLLLSEELHGQSLIRKKVITADQLTLALQVQLLAQMEALSELPPETVFQYFDGYDALASYGGESTVQLDPYPLVWTCLRKQPPWSHIQPVLAGVGNAAIRLVSTADTRRFSFDKAEQDVVDLLKARPQHLHELTAAANALPPRTALVLVYCLIVTKQVASVAASPAQKAAAAAKSEPPKVPSEPPPISAPVETPRVEIPAAELTSQVPSSNPAATPLAASDSSRPTAPPPPGHDVPEQARPSVPKIPKMAPPPKIPMDNVHTRSTVPRLAAPSAAEIAAFTAQQDALAKSARQGGSGPVPKREASGVIVTEKSAPQSTRKTMEIPAVTDDALDEPFADKK
jgi:hypothetical protein